MPRPRPSAPALAASAMASSQRAKDSGAPVIIGKLRKQKLDLGTRSMPAESVSLSKSRFIHLSETELRISELPSNKQVAQVPVAQPRRLVVLRDGSALVLGATETVLVTRRKHDVVRLRRISLFPQSKVLPDLHRSRRFWVLHAFDSALYGYELDDDDGLVTLDVREIKDFDKRVFALLRDGSFLHTTQQGLVRMYLAGRRQQLSLDTTGAFRLLPGRRLDRIWLARQSGQLQLVSLLGSRSKVISTFQVDGVFDVASGADKVAVLRVARKNQERHFEVELYSNKGKLLWSDSLELGIDSATGDDWLARVARNRGIALSDDAKWLAVGGPGAAVLWDAAKGKRVLTR